MKRRTLFLLLSFVFIITFALAQSSWYWKQWNFIDYAPQGIPDFDQKQDQWQCSNSLWSHCGPVAVANCLWWFDSKFEPDPVPPPAPNDNYPLVINLLPLETDDHIPNNVIPVVNDLAWRMDTNGAASGLNYCGTYIHNMVSGIKNLLIERGLDDEYIISLVKAPTFDWVVKEVEKSENVILLLGFWERQSGRWVRVGGHYVTASGIDSKGFQIAFSDPYKDVSEGARGSMNDHPPHPGDPTVHNDANFVSHDIYKVSPTYTPGGVFGPDNYYIATGPGAFPYPPQNIATDLEPYLGTYQGGQIFVEVDYAIGISPDWHWKQGGWIDYALSGMPDFDQKKDAWMCLQQWSWCGPNAVADCFWWFDSKFEPQPVPPPAWNDHYPLVQAYPLPIEIDDHDPNNVDPLIVDLAGRMDTDGQSSGDTHCGTYLEDMHSAVLQYLVEKGLDDDYYVKLRKSPDFAWLAKEIEKCQDIILLLGFWEFQQLEEWRRIGGHYVTSAGVNQQDTLIAFSDPYRDVSEGAMGETNDHPPHPGDPTVHNDTQFVSHDIYPAIDTNSPGGVWGPAGYYDPMTEPFPFPRHNIAQDLIPFIGEYMGGPVQTEVDYALEISPCKDPQVIRNLQAKADKIRFTWDPDPNSESYDVIRGYTDDLPNFDIADCIGPDISDIFIDDFTPPPVSMCYYYLVRGRFDPCRNTGSYGRMSNGTERSSIACP